MDGSPLLPREPNARIAGLDGLDRAPDRRVGERVGAVDRREPGFLGDVALDPQLLGMAEPDFAFVDAEDEGDGIAVMDEAALLDEIYNRVTTASTSSLPPVAPASIRPRAAWTRSRSASRTAAFWNSAESASDARA